MISAGILTAVLLGATPCATVPVLEQGLSRAETAPAWKAALARAEKRFAPIPLEPPAMDALASAKGRKTADAWVKSRLESICAPQAVPAKTALPDRDRLTRILARPEFANQGSARVLWWQRILEKIGHWLEWLLGTKGASGFARATRVLVLGGAALVALFAIWRVLRKLRFRRRSEERSGGPTGVPLRLDPPADHLTKARAALDGNPREAIRQSLFALLSWLERRRWARPDRVKTNREILLELPGRGAPEELASRIALLVQWYDRAFYSLSPVDGVEARRFLEQVARISEGG